MEWRKGVDVALERNVVFNRRPIWNYIADHAEVLRRRHFKRFEEWALFKGKDYHPSYTHVEDSLE